MSQDLEFNKNEDHNKLLVSKLKHILEKVSLGGGKSRIEKLHAQGKMSARERISALIDENSQFLEIGALAGYEMYEEHGGCPSGGVVGGIGYVSGRQCVIVANDATVKSGCLVSDNWQEKSAFSGNCYGESFADYLPGRFSWCLFAYAG